MVVVSESVLRAGFLVVAPAVRGDLRFGAAAKKFRTNPWHLSIGNRSPTARLFAHVETGWRPAGSHPPGEYYTILQVCSVVLAVVTTPRVQVCTVAYAL